MCLHTTVYYKKKLCLHCRRSVDHSLQWCKRPHMWHNWLLFVIIHSCMYLYLSKHRKRTLFQTLPGPNSLATNIVKSALCYYSAHVRSKIDAVKPQISLLKLISQLFFVLRLTAIKRLAFLIAVWADIYDKYMLRVSHWHLLYGLCDSVNVDQCEWHLSVQLMSVAQL